MSLFLSRRIQRFLLPAACAVSLLLLSSSSYAQSVINVPADQPTIQAAINAANNGDTVLVAPGTYAENINFNGKAITVTSSGGSSATTIDGGAKGAVVTFNSGESASSQLSGFTIRNGFQNGLAGGGIIVSGASPTISSNVITGNHAAIGIGIYVNGGSPAIKNNTITANDQTGAGDGGQGGGGILVSGSSTIPAAPQIIGNTITSNSVASGGNGGGISVTYFSSPLIQANLIQGNTAYNSGGGISVQSYNSLSFIENIIVNNTSLAGGSGGGIWVSPGSSPQTFLNNTIGGNAASDGTSGVFVTGFGRNVTFTNNIIVAASGQAVTCNSTYSSASPFFSFNDAYSVSGQAWAGICDATTNPGNISVDPLFKNGTTDFQLQSNSPAIDAGDNSPSNLPSTDFDGNTRIWDGNNDCISTIDLGAYEFVNLMGANIFPSSLSFGSLPTGTTSASQSASATSSLATCWQFASIQVVGPFLQTNNCPTRGIPAGTSCAFNFVFAPTNADIGGLVHGYFLANSIVGTSLYVDLYGTALGPIVSLSPLSLVFPQQIVATTSAPQTVTLSNVGNSPLSINSLSATGDFVFNSGCGNSVNAGTSCPIYISFAPSAYGTRTGSLFVSDNATAYPQSTGLSGTAVDFQINVIPNSISLVQGASTELTVSLAPLGGPFNSPVAFSCSGAPSHSSCTVSPAQVTPGSGGASAVMTVTTDKPKTPLGSYALTITGTYGALSHSIQIPLVVMTKH